MNLKSALASKEVIGESVTPLAQEPVTRAIETKMRGKEKSSGKVDQFPFDKAEKWEGGLW